MESKLYGTRLYISSSKLEHNVIFLKRHFNYNNLIAMVKANAYGYGDIGITQALQNMGINIFGVADFDEGLRLRKYGIKGSIIVMNPGLYNLQFIIENEMEPVIYNQETLLRLTQILKNNKLNKTLPIRTIDVHIKVNTGMNRWGFNVPHLPKLISSLEKLQRVHVKSVYSHLSSSSSLQDDSFTRDQINQFKIVRKLFNTQFKYPINYHLFNSSAFLRDFQLENPHSIRAGILLYGAINNKHLKSIAELRCAISDIRIVKAGDTVGYRRSYKAKKQMKIGVLPFGYADGLQRAWGNGTLKFFYNENLLPTIGDISMDSCIIDLSDLSDISVGDDVIYFGEKRPIWDLAKELNTIPYEITSALSRRIKRIYN